MIQVYDILIPTTGYHHQTPSEPILDIYSDCSILHPTSETKGQKILWDINSPHKLHWCRKVNGVSAKYINREKIKINEDMNLVMKTNTENIQHGSEIMIVLEEQTKCTVHRNMSCWSPSIYSRSKETLTNFID
jgi:uncharacterized protein involved in tolerance to divalent cations